MSIICFAICGVCFLCLLFSLCIENSWGISFFLVWTLISLVVGFIFHNMEKRQEAEKIRAEEVRFENARKEAEQKKQKQESLDAYIAEHIKPYAEILHKYFTPMCPIGVTRIYENNQESERFFITIWEDNTLVLLTEEMAVLNRLGTYFDHGNNSPHSLFRLILIPFNQIEFTVSKMNLATELKKNDYKSRTLVRWFDVKDNGQREYNTLQIASSTDVEQYIRDKNATLDPEKLYPNNKELQKKANLPPTWRYHKYHLLDSSSISAGHWYTQLFWKNPALSALDLGKIFDRESYQLSTLWREKKDHANQKDKYDLCIDYLEKLRCFSDLDWFYPESIDGLIRRIKRDQSSFRSENPNSYSPTLDQKYFYHS